MNRKRKVASVVCVWACVYVTQSSASPSHPSSPLCRSRPQPLVRQPLRLPCFDRCSLCPNASLRTLWRLSHSPSLSLYFLLRFSCSSFLLYFWPLPILFFLLPVLLKMLHSPENIFFAIRINSRSTGTCFQIHYDNKTIKSKVTSVGELSLLRLPPGLIWTH